MPNMTKDHAHSGFKHKSVLQTATRQHDPQKATLVANLFGKIVIQMNISNLTN